MNSNFVFIILIVIILFLYYKLHYGNNQLSKTTVRYNPAIMHPACL